MKSEGFFAQLYGFCHYVIERLSILMVLVILALNVVYHITILGIAEQSTMTYNLTGSILTAVFAAAVLGLVWRMRLPLKNVRLDEKRLFAACSLIYSIAALYLILNVDGVVRADAEWIYDAAIAFNQGDYRRLDPTGYMGHYPHQLGMVTLERLLLSFSPNTKVLFLFNFFLVLVTNYILYGIADLLFQNQRVNVLTILLSFGFLPHLFFILFAYGLIPSLCAMMAAFYYALKFDRQGQKGPLALMLLFAAISVLLKKNSLIAVMAIILYLFIRWLRNRQMQKVAAIVLLVLCLLFPFEFLKYGYEKKANVQLTGTPSILWLAMGTDIENKLIAPGWYDGSVWDMYIESGYDAQLASEMGKEKLLYNVEKMGKYPRATVVFFIKKTISQWCDPLYQSIWSGPLVDCGQETYTDLTKSIYDNGSVYQYLMVYAKAYSLILWFLVAFFLIVYGKKTEGWEMFTMFFMGGAIFHTFWEGKSQYVLPFVIVLIPFAAYGLYRICKWDGIGYIRAFLKEKSRKTSADK